MPVYKVGNKYKVGHKGKAMYDTRAEAYRAYQGYLYTKYGKGKKRGKESNS